MREKRQRARSLGGISLAAFALGTSAAACGPSSEDRVQEQRVCECFAQFQRLEAETDPSRRATAAQLLEAALTAVREGGGDFEPARVRELVSQECPERSRARAAPGSEPVRST